MFNYTMYVIDEYDQRVVGINETHERRLHRCPMLYCVNAQDFNVTR